MDYDSKGLLVPINFGQNPDSVSQASWLLSCFEYTSMEMKSVELNPPFSQWSAPFTEPTLWLATMIVQGCCEVEKLFDITEASQFLNSLDRVAYEEYLKDCGVKEFVMNPWVREGLGGKTGSFGFRLHHGVNGATAHNTRTTVTSIIYALQRSWSSVQVIFSNKRRGNCLGA